MIKEENDIVTDPSEESPTPKIRPETTLVLASSADGRITSSDSNDLDTDPKWKTIPGVRGYLQQSFGISSEPGTFNLIPGTRMAQAGVNIRTGKPEKENIRLIVLDHHRNLTPQGIHYLVKCVTKLIIVCGKKHPITKEENLEKNLTVITQSRFDRHDLMKQLKGRGVKKITIQSAGKLNAKWINEGLVDHVTIILYPLLVGTAGTSVLTNSKTSIAKPLRLIDIRPFNLNYISLNYKVIND